MRKKKMKIRTFDIDCETYGKMTVSCNDRPSVGGSKKPKTMITE